METVTVNKEDWINWMRPRFSAPGGNSKEEWAFDWNYFYRYMKRKEKTRKKAMDELVKQAQEKGMGY